MSPPSGQDPDKDTTSQAVLSANAMYDESIAILDKIDEPSFTDKQSRIDFVKDTLNAMKQLING